ncbi:hypothetical protein BRADI_1g35386v3, partial [Brachypodium distachyon]
MKERKPREERKKVQSSGGASEGDRAMRARIRQRRRQRREAGRRRSCVAAWPVGWRRWLARGGIRRSSEQQGVVVVGEGREGRGGWRREGGGGDGSVGAGLRREGLQRERREIMGEKEGEPVVCRGTAERRRTWWGGRKR